MVVVVVEDVVSRDGVRWLEGGCNSRKLKDNRAEVTSPPSPPPSSSRLLLLAPLRTRPRPDNAHPVSFTLVFHVTAKRSWLPTRRKRGETDVVFGEWRMMKGGERGGGRKEEEWKREMGSCFKLVTPWGKSGGSRESA